MRDVAVRLIHAIATIARLIGCGGARAVVAESLLLRHQLLTIHCNRDRDPNLCPTDRAIAALCAAWLRPCRVLAAAILIKRSRFMACHRALVQQELRLPHLVNKNTGDIVQLGTAYPVNDYIDRYENTGTVLS